MLRGFQLFARHPKAPGIAFPGTPWPLTGEAPLWRVRLLYLPGGALLLFGLILLDDLSPIEIEWPDFALVHDVVIENSGRGPASDHNLRSEPNP